VDACKYVGFFCPPGQDYIYEHGLARASGAEVVGFAYADNSILNLCGDYTGVWSLAEGSIHIADLEITGPGGTVPVSMNWQAEGLVYVSHCVSPNPRGCYTYCPNVVTSEFYWVVHLAGVEIDEFFAIIWGNGCGNSLSLYGQALSWEIEPGEGSATLPNQTFSTQEADVPVNTTIQVELFFRATTHVNNADAAVASVAISLPYGDSALGGPTPVFNLPFGYTANSKSANIVDNVWVFEDCNGTGAPDMMDIASGVSLDVNGNAVPDECECLWDLDASGAVGIFDLLALLAAWGTDPAGPPDFDGDGVVGITDLLALLAAWGPCQ
jgi:hypothetical protein